MRFAKDFFIYQLDFENLLAATTQTDNIAIQADANFRWEKATVFTLEDISSSITQFSDALAQVTVLIVDSGSGRQLMDQAVPIPNFFGNGRIPFILPTKRTFVARSNITFTVVNINDTINFATLRLSLIGTKLFPIG